MSYQGLKVVISSFCYTSRSISSYSRWFWWKKKQKRLKVSDERRSLMTATANVLRIIIWGHIFEISDPLIGEVLLSISMFSLKKRLRITPEWKKVRGYGEGRLNIKTKFFEVQHEQGCVLLTPTMLPRALLPLQYWLVILSLGWATKLFLPLQT